MPCTTLTCGSREIYYGIWGDSIGYADMPWCVQWALSIPDARGMLQATRTVGANDEGASPVTDGCHTASAKKPEALWGPQHCGGACCGPWRAGFGHFPHTRRIHGLCGAGGFVLVAHMRGFMTAR